MHGTHGKLSVGECAGLVEHHGIHLCQYVHKVGTFDKDASARSTADASEEGQGHADYEGTRTRYHQEHQGTIEPARHQGQGYRHEYHHWCVDTGKAGDEGLAL